MSKIKFIKAPWVVRFIFFPALLHFFFACQQENRTIHSSEVLDKSVTLSNETETEDYLASVGTSGITKERFRKEALILGGFSNIEDQEKAKQSLLQRLIFEELLFNKGLSLNLDLDEDIQRTLKKLIVKKIKDKEWQAKLDEITVTEKEIKNYYEQNKELYQIPEMRRGALLSLKFKFGESAQSKQKKKNLIFQIHKYLSKNPNSFAEQVRKYSDDQRTKFKGGLLNWLPKEAGVYSLPAEVVQRLFEIEKTGQISPVIEKDTGFFIVKLVDLKSPKTHSLARVKSDVEEKILTEKKQAWTNEYIQALKREFPVKIDQSMLKTITEETWAKKITSGPPSFPVGKSE